MEGEGGGPTSKPMKGDENRYLVLSKAKGSETTSPSGVIKPKAMKDDKGREGGHKIGKMGRRRLWMSPLVVTKVRV